MRILNLTKDISKLNEIESYNTKQNDMIANIFVDKINKPIYKVSGQ